MVVVATLVGSRMSANEVYSYRVLDPAGKVIATGDIVRTTTKPGPVVMTLSAPPIKPASGSFANGQYRTEILLNGVVGATLYWSVG